MTEIFVPIKGYEGLYEVSNFGMIKSLPKGDGNGNRERLLKFDIIKNGTNSYRRVTFSFQNKQVRKSVHRIVAEAFIENPENKPFINHIDNNGENNNVSNLEWCTQSENMIHAQKQGRLHEAQSRGGKKNLVSDEQALVKYAHFVGQKKGTVTIVGIAGRKGIKNDFYLNALCDCGKKYEVNMSQFSLNRASSCRSCSLRESHKKRKIKI